MWRRCCAGFRDVGQVPRSVCAMGHKWMWNESLGGFPPEEFLVAVDPLLAGVREKLRRTLPDVGHHRGDVVARNGPSSSGCKPGIPIPVGAFDAHWDAVGAGVTLGDVVNVIGTSTCIIGLSDRTTLVPGVCGVVPGRCTPSSPELKLAFRGWRYLRSHRAARGFECGGRCRRRLREYRAGQTGLLRLTWDNGDRTVLVNPELGGVTLGWHLTQYRGRMNCSPRLRARRFIPGLSWSAWKSMASSVQRVINGGGIPQRTTC